MWNTWQVHSIIMSGNKNDRMEVKPARLTVLIDAEKKKAFEELCAARDITASQVLRQLIRDYMEENGIGDEPA
jgi:hypothetical protein